MLLLQLRYTSMTAARPPGKSHREGRGSAAAGLSGLLEQIRVGWNRRRRSTDPVNLLYPLGVDRIHVARWNRGAVPRSEEHTSELQSLMRISYAVFCLQKKKQQH